MAGGPFAAAVMCLTCLGRADRTGEGQETDWYLCSRCGKKFGMDWSDGAPQTPEWPPTAAHLAEVRRLYPWLVDAIPADPPGE